jgi:hypothetical protein
MTAKEDYKPGKAESIAYSMKLVNGVYNKLIAVLQMQLREDYDEFTRGWNSGLTAAIGMIQTCKYTKDDYLKMMQEDE